LILPIVCLVIVFDSELFGECRHALPNQLTLLSHHSSLLMPHHQFHVGQTVHLWRPALAGYAAVGAYEIRAVLPEQEGRRRYRIKSLIEPHERVVSEIELSEELSILSARDVLVSFSNERLRVLHGLRLR